MIEVGDFTQQDYFAPKGWICPKCGRVYAPSTPMCWYCGGEKTITNQPTITAVPPPGWHDWLQHMSAPDIPSVTYSTTTWASSETPDTIHVSINSYPTTCLN